MMQNGRIIAVWMNNTVGVEILNQTTPRIAQPTEGKLLKKVDQAAAEAGRKIDVLIQVDLALEETKFGAPVGEVRSIVDAAAGCTAATLTGLMLLPPLVEDPQAARPWFARLRALRDELAASGVPQDRLRELSMGMSHDFEVAIAEGATMVRVGTAIFGERHYP